MTNDKRTKMAKLKQTNTVVTTQTVEAKVIKEFESKFEKLKKFATKNGLKLPKKGEVMSRIISSGTASVDTDNYFGE